LQAVAELVKTKLLIIGSESEDRSILVIAAMVGGNHFGRIFVKR